MFRTRYGSVFEGDDRWRAMAIGGGDTFAWDRASTYVLQAAVLRAASAAEPTPVADIVGARVLAVLGDSVTTDHISPAGSIRPSSPAGRVPHRPRRGAARSSTPTGPGAATTRS